MFETLEKARQLGAIALERIGEYLELFRISAEIQGQHLKKRILSFVVVALFAGLSLIFLGLAIIVTCWDTSYREAAAWGVAILYAFIALGAYKAGQSQAGPASALATLRDEVEQDVKLMKDVV
jgi:uncharacterized membrane protein YqjE